MPRPFEPPGETPLEAQHGQTFPSLVDVMRRLLGPDGCPWDREQDYASLRQFVMEEACEVIDAIDAGDLGALEEELGDLALQIVFLSELARGEGAFGPDDVVRGICEKLVRRHPHVFGDVSVSGSAEVLRNWDAIKAEEKKGRGLLDGIPKSLPALRRAQRTGDKTRKVGFDWPDGAGSRAKVTEELGELDEAIAGGDRDRIEAELGDLLFAIVNLARHHDVGAEEALRGTIDRYTKRFEHVEQRVRARHGDWPRDDRGKATTGIGLDELDAYWNEAKREER